LSPEIRWRSCEVCRAKERAVKKGKRVAEQAAAKELERLREIVNAMQAKGVVADLEAEGQQGKIQTNVGGTVAGVGISEDPEDEDEDATEEEQVDMNDNENADGHADSADEKGGPDVSSNKVVGSDAASPSVLQIASFPAARGTEPIVSPVTISSGSKGETYHSVFRTKTVADEDSTGASKPKILTANLSDSDGFTFKEYQPKMGSSAVGRLLGQNLDLSVQVFKDLLAPKEKVRHHYHMMFTYGLSMYHLSKQTRALWVRRRTMFIRAISPHVQSENRPSSYRLFLSLHHLYTSLRQRRCA
jgi:hypothetical protein